MIDFAEKRKDVVGSMIAAVLGREDDEFAWAIRTAWEQCKDAQAHAYLGAMGAAIRDYGLDGLRVQILYVLSNTQYWRGETARKVKKIFKERVAQIEKVQEEIKRRQEGREDPSVN